jgi:hypothetical protein
MPNYFNPQDVYRNRYTNIFNPFQDQPTANPWSFDVSAPGVQEPDQPEQFPELYNEPTPILEQYQQQLGRIPTRDKVGIGSKLLAALAGMAQGMQGGNAAVTTRALIDLPYNQKVEEWKQKSDTLGKQAAIESSNVGRKSAMAMTMAKRQKDIADAERQRLKDEASIKESGARAQYYLEGGSRRDPSRYINTAAGLYDTIEKKLVGGTAPVSKPGAERKKNYNYFTQDDGTIVGVNDEDPKDVVPVSGVKGKSKVTPDGTPKPEAVGAKDKQTARESAVVRMLQEHPEYAQFITDEPPYTVKTWGKDKSLYGVKDGGKTWNSYQKFLQVFKQLENEELGVGSAAPTGFNVRLKSK